MGRLLALSWVLLIIGCGGRDPENQTGMFRASSVTDDPVLNVTYVPSNDFSGTITPLVDGKPVYLPAVQSGYEPYKMSADNHYPGSPFRNLYFRVPPGPHSVALDVGGPPSSLSFEPKKVYTFVYYGSSDSPQVQLFTDDQGPLGPDHSYHEHLINVDPQRKPLTWCYVSGDQAPVLLAKDVPYGSSVDVDVVATDPRQDSLWITDRDGPVGGEPVGYPRSRLNVSTGDPWMGPYWSGE
jgi:hypothetical protein